MEDSPLMALGFFEPKESIDQEVFQTVAFSESCEPEAEEDLSYLALTDTPAEEPDVMAAGKCRKGYMRCNTGNVCCPMPFTPPGQKPREPACYQDDNGKFKCKPDCGKVGGTSCGNSKCCKSPRTCVNGECKLPFCDPADACECSVPGECCKRIAGASCGYDRNGQCGCQSGCRWDGKGCTGKCGVGKCEEKSPGSKTCTCNKPKPDACKWDGFKCGGSCGKDSQGNERQCISVGNGQCSCAVPCGQGAGSCGYGICTKPGEKCIAQSGGGCSCELPCQSSGPSCGGKCNNPAGSKVVLTCQPAATASGCACRPDNRTPPPTCDCFPDDSDCKCPEPEECPCPPGGNEEAKAICERNEKGCNIFGLLYCPLNCGSNCAGRAKIFRDENGRCPTWEEIKEDVECPC